MTKEQLTAHAKDFTNSAPANRVPAEKALRAELAGMQMYDAPLVGFASAEDGYLLGLAETPAANLPLEPPVFWLDGAKTVISFFLPFTEQVRASNRGDPGWPSEEWIQVRIDGQPFIEALGDHLVEALAREGYRAVVPSFDERFKARFDAADGPFFTSNWSERHVAYACGLGTFSLSKGLITKNGVAGRFGSLVTDLSLPPDERPYTGLTDYCSDCGACARRCPVDAIQNGNKLHPPCTHFLDEVRAVNPPYYGCGKCQVGVPCEAGAPGAQGD